MASTAAAIGYWGPVTAQHTWCEPDYYYTSYVAELGNTVSSVALIYLGVVSYQLANEQQRSTRFKLGAAWLAITGFGSVAFHGTLLYHAQLADELPMMACTAVYAYTLIESWRVNNWSLVLPAVGTTANAPAKPKGISATHVTVACLGYAFLVVALMAAFPTSHVPFLIGYKSTIGFHCWFSVSLLRRNPDFSRSFVRRFMIAYLGGAVFWYIEYTLCHWSTILWHFHSVWHVGAGLGTFWFMEYTAELDARIRNYPVRYATRLAGLLPYVVADKSRLKQH